MSAVDNLFAFSSTFPKPGASVAGSGLAGVHVANPTPISIWIMDPRRTEAECTPAILAEVRRAARRSHRSIVSVTYAEEIEDGRSTAVTLPSTPMAALTGQFPENRLVIALLFERHWKIALALLGAFSLLRKSALETPVTQFVPILVEENGGIAARAGTDLTEALRQFPYTLRLPETAIRVEHGGIVEVSPDLSAALEEIFRTEEIP